MESKQPDIEIPKNIIASGSLIHIATRMLYNMNSTIVTHNMRTTFIAMNLVKHFNLNPKCTLQNLFILSLFHTIGFFREDIAFKYSPYESNVSFFSTKKSIESKYVFGCYYLAYMTPLKNSALALENFNQPFNADLKHYIYQEDYKSIIYFSARLSDYLYRNSERTIPDDLDSIAPGMFDPDVVKAFKEANKDNSVIQKIIDYDYSEELNRYLDKLVLTEEEQNAYLKMIIYLLDFKSTSTLKHSINTSCYALALAKRLNLSKADTTTLFTSSFLHDIGKICTPQRILEAPGKLTPEDMGIMKHHVNHSKRLLKDLIPDEILETIYRHHEKLNGSGYPKNLSKDELTQIQRILTVADITSALFDSRSYKHEFSKEQTLAIIRQMTDNEELDRGITDILCNNFDSIQEELPRLQEILTVDYSSVIREFNNYLFSSTYDLWSNNFDDNIEELEELKEA